MSDGNSSCSFETRLQLNNPFPRIDYSLKTQQTNLRVFIAHPSKKTDLEPN